MGLTDIGGYSSAKHGLAVVVPWAVVRRGAELEERRGLVPVVALGVAWVFEPGSSPFNNPTTRLIYPGRCPGVEGSGMKYGSAADHRKG